MIFKRTAIFVGIFVILSCSANGISFKKQDLHIESGQGLISIQAEIAVTSEQRNRGFMERTEIPDGTGMLFIFDRDQILSFWMKNTLVPLSIAFIASDGRILEIRDMEALDLHSVTSKRSGRYALEVPQGWFDRVGIVPGDRLVVDFLSSTA
ncbi:hypothetical protein FACS1894172_07110 [Spirochaetia bacterium]|nr:hypothetical protein FACS1894172_07110 [Spirochaetia bacterium]